MSLSGAQLGVTSLLGITNAAFGRLCSPRQCSRAWFSDCRYWPHSRTRYSIFFWNSKTNKNKKKKENAKAFFLAYPFMLLVRMLFHGIWQVPLGRPGKGGWDVGGQRFASDSRGWSCVLYIALFLILFRLSCRLFLRRGYPIKILDQFLLPICRFCSLFLLGLMCFRIKRSSSDSFGKQLTNQRSNQTDNRKNTKENKRKYHIRSIGACVSHQH